MPQPGQIALEAAPWSRCAVGCNNPSYYCEDTGKIDTCGITYGKDCVINQGSVFEEHTNCDSYWEKIQKK